MRPSFLLLLAAACAPTEEIEPFDVDTVPLEEVLGDELAGSSVVAPRAPLILTVDPLVAGQSATLEVSSLAPGETTYIAYSLYGTGNGICPAAMGGQCLNLLSPVVLLATVQADATGVATFSAPVPAAAPVGLAVSFQAVAIRGLGGAQTVKSPAVTEVVAGGAPGDDFVHVPASVDLLFVLDDSCSMSLAQQNLANSFPATLATLTGLALDYHVGVVTTDMTMPTKSGRLQPDAQGHRYLEPTTTQPALAFGQMANVGTNGSGIEEGLAAFEASLDPAIAVNAGFRRVDAQYAVVVVSDEDDQSANVGPNQAASTMRAEASHPGDSTFSSIVTPVGGCVPNGVTVGTRYLNTTALVGGETESICVANYAPVLDDLVITWWTSQPYVLSARPANPATIAVTVDGVPVAAGDWEYEPIENAVRFTNGFGPAAGAAVHVTY